MPRYSFADLGPSLKDVATRVATEEGVRPDLIHAVMQQESRGNPIAVSPKGALGVMQLMPGTAVEMGVTNPYDPEQNLRGGVRYLKQQLDRFGGDETLALAAYNAGPGAVAKARGVPNYPETRDYVQRIQGRLGQAGGPPTGSPPPQSPAAASRPQLLSVPRDVATPDASGEGRYNLTDLAPGTAASAGGPPASPSAVTGGPPPPAPSFARTLLTGLDPRTPGGRRNLAGGAGAIAAGAFTGGMGAIPAFLTVAGGAGAGGMLAEGVEQTVGDAPPSLAGVAGAGAEQAAYEALGGAIAWPVKALGRRVLSPIVARHARTSLQTVRQTLGTQLDSLLTRAQDLVKTARVSKTAAQGVQREAGITAQEAAKATGQAGVTRARTTRTADIEHYRAGLRGTPPGPPPTQVGAQVGTVLKGPAQATLNAVGKEVEDAAATGPEVAWAPVKAHLRAMVAQAYPDTLRPTSDTASEGIGYAHNLMAKASTPEEKQAILTMIGEQLGPAADHPLPKVLAQLLDAPDTLSFADAHKFKRLLDETVDWSHPARKRVQQLTKGIRTTIRDTMTGFEPYDRATEAYARLVPLYRRGLAPKVVQQLTEYPQYVINTVSPTQPTKLAILKELLTVQAAKSGGEQAGRQAWDSVRSALIYKHVTRGPLNKLPERLATLRDGEGTAEFYSLLAGDDAGRGVLDRLSQIAQGYTRAAQSGLLDIANAKEASALLQQDAARAARQALGATTRQHDTRIARLLTDVQAARVAQKAAKAPTAAERAFEKSTVARTLRRPEQIASDLMMAATRGGYSLWGNLALLRLLQGPRSADLAHWAARSPESTRMLVTLATTPLMGMAAADSYRLLNLLGRFYTETDAPDSQQLTGADGRRLTRGVVQSLGGEPGPPRLRVQDADVLGAEEEAPTVEAPTLSAPPPPPSAF